MPMRAGEPDTAVSANFNMIQGFLPIDDLLAFGRFVLEDHYALARVFSIVGQSGLQ